jgi:CDP-6-deoxy-D-xylo-4-hexulose-3-dehydrase
MEGAIGQEQLKKLPSFVNERRANALHFQEKFKNHPLLMIQKEIGESSWFGFSMVIRPEINIDRKQFVSVLEKNKIEARPIVAGNFAKNEVVKYFNYEIFNELKNAQWIDTKGLFVGNNQVDIRKQIDLLEKALGEIH